MSNSAIRPTVKPKLLLTEWMVDRFVLSLQVQSNKSGRFERALPLCIVKPPEASERRPLLQHT